VPADERLVILQRANERGNRLGLPEFASATATSRSSPRRFARFTGEPLKRRENSA
jgi:hypothetical protein